MSRKAKQIGSDLDLAAWCAVLASPIVPDVVPPGWHTSRQLCKVLGKSDSRMLEMLRQAIDAGKCERKEFRVPSGGVTRPVPHYKLK